MTSYLYRRLLVENLWISCKVSQILSSKYIKLPLVKWILHGSTKTSCITIHYSTFLIAHETSDHLSSASGAFMSFLQFFLYYVSYSRIQSNYLFFLNSTRRKRIWLQSLCSWKIIAIVLPKRISRGNVHLDISSYIFLWT